MRSEFVMRGHCYALSKYDLLQDIDRGPTLYVEASHIDSFRLTVRKKNEYKNSNR